MKSLMTAMLGLSLLVPAMILAQDTGGDKAKTATNSGKKATKSKAKSKSKKTTNVNASTPSSK